MVNRMYKKVSIEEFLKYIEETAMYHSAQEVHNAQYIAEFERKMRVFYEVEDELIKRIDETEKWYHSQERALKGTKFNIFNRIRNEIRGVLE